MAFVNPQSSDVVLLVSVVFALAVHNILHDFTKVSHVELMEEFIGVRYKLGVLAHP